MSGLVAPSQVQVVALNVAAAVSSTVTKSVTVTNAGDDILVGIVNPSETTAGSFAASAVSGLGATWTRLGNTTDTTAGSVDVWLGVNASAGAGTLTITTPGATDSVGAAIEEWSGLPTIESVAFGASSSATGSSTHPAVSLQPQNLGDLLWVMSLSANTQTGSPASPYTTETGPTTSGSQKAGSAYWVASTMTANTAQWTQTTGHWAVVGVLLYAAQPDGYAILNTPTAAINAAETAPQASPDYVDSIITAAVELGTGVVSGGAVSPNTNSDFKFQMAAAVDSFAGSQVSVAAVTAQSITTADSTNPRRDLVYVTPAGTVVYAAGTPAAVPLIPMLPRGCVAHAVIEVPANATSLQWPPTSGQAYVNDKRPLMAPSLIGSTFIITSNNASWPIPAGAKYLEIIVVGGGGGGGGGGSASSAITQTGGGGGGSGSVGQDVVAVGANTTLNVTVGAGGSGGTSSASGGNSGGGANSGGNSSVTATGISVAAYGGSGGNGSSANSTSAASGGCYGQKGGGFPLQSSSSVGQMGLGGASGGGQGYSGYGYSGGSGAPGQSATTTVGGGGGSAASSSQGGVYGNPAGVPTGQTGATPTTYGAGGNGGGGGAWNGGSSPGGGGAGGNGGPGVVIIKVVG